MLRRYLILWVALAALLHHPLAVSAEPIKTLKARGYVNDFAGVLDAESVRTMERICGQLDQKSKAQIAVVTVKSLDGMSIEKYSHDLFNQWGVGPKESNEGVMILIAMKEARWRIQTGRGLTSVVTNAEAQKIGNGALPLLEAEKYGQALAKMTRLVAEDVAYYEDVTLDPAPNANAPLPLAAAPVTAPPSSPPTGASLVAGLLFMLIVLAAVVWVVRLLLKTMSSAVHYGTSPGTYAPSYNSGFHPYGMFSGFGGTHRYYSSGPAQVSSAPAAQSSGWAGGGGFGGGSDFHGFGGGSTDADSGSSGSISSGSGSSASGGGDSGSGGSFGGGADNTAAQDSAGGSGSDTAASDNSASDSSSSDSSASDSSSSDSSSSDSSSSDSSSSDSSSSGSSDSSSGDS